MTRVLIMLGLVLGIHRLPGVAMPLTGNVPADFNSQDYVEIPDTAGDVGIPPNAPAGTQSGWDFERILFHLDMEEEALYLGLDYIGIAGDADGDGGEGTSSIWLLSNGGTDMPGFQGTESICVALDFAPYDQYEVMTGYSALNGDHSICLYYPAALGMPFSFATSSPLAGDHAVGPDYEARIDQLASLTDLSGEELCMRFRVFSGSLQDDGIGEDILLGEVCLRDQQVVEAAMPQTAFLMEAWPNPFNPRTTLSLTLDHTAEGELNLYNLQGQLVKRLHAGVLGTGRHDFALDASALPSGLYLATASYGELKRTERLLLSR